MDRLQIRIWILPRTFGKFEEFLRWNISKSSIHHRPLLLEPFLPFLRSRDYFVNLVLEGVSIKIMFCNLDKTNYFFE